MEKKYFIIVYIMILSHNSLFCQKSDIFTECIKMHNLKEDSLKEINVIYREFLDSSITKLGNLSIKYWDVDTLMHKAEEVPNFNVINVKPIFSYQGELYLKVYGCGVRSENGGLNIIVSSYTLYKIKYNCKKRRFDVVFIRREEP